MMNSKVVKWFKRQASIRRFTEKGDKAKSSAPTGSSDSPSDEKRKLSFGRLSFRKKHKKKEPGTTAASDEAVNQGIVGISKQYSYSVPQEMESKSRDSNGAAVKNAISLDNSLSTNSPTKSATGSKTISNHSSFDDDTQNSDCSRGFLNSTTSEMVTQSVKDKPELEFEHSRTSDAFHTCEMSPIKPTLNAVNSRVTSSSDTHQNTGQGGDNKENKLSEEISVTNNDVSGVMSHHQDMAYDKNVIPQIVIDAVSSKPPLAAVESYSSDDLSNLSDFEGAEMNKCDEISDTRSDNFRDNDSLLNDHDKEVFSDVRDDEAISEDSSKSENTNALCDASSSNNENDMPSLNSFDKSDEKVTIICENGDFGDDIDKIGNRKAVLTDKISERTDHSLDSTPVQSVPHLCEGTEASDKGIIPTLDTADTQTDTQLIGTVVGHSDNRCESPSADEDSVDLSSDTTPNTELQIYSKAPQEPQTSTDEKERVELVPSAVGDNANDIGTDDSVSCHHTDSLTLPSLYPSLNSFDNDEKCPDTKPPGQLHLSECKTLSSSRNSLEYPDELNPFNDQYNNNNEENSVVTHSQKCKTKENDITPFGAETELEKYNTAINKQYKVMPSSANDHIANTQECFKGRHSKFHSGQKSSDVSNSKSLNPFDESDDEGTVNGIGQKGPHFGGDTPPTLPPKSDIQRRKNSGSSLVPIPRPRRSKQLHHGSTTSLQCLPSVPVPAPRSIASFGSTRTLNETSSGNPFEDDDDDDSCVSSFQRRVLGRLSVQAQYKAEESASTGELLNRQGVRGSVPATARFRPRKKRQAPLPPGGLISKPPQAPASLAASSPNPRQRSSASPEPESGSGRSSSSKSVSPHRSAPPRPPPPRI